MKRVSALWTNNKVRSECRIHGSSDPFLTNLTYNSSEAGPQIAFVAIKGQRFDAHQFIKEAIAQGSPLIIHSDPLPKYDPSALYIAHPHPKRVASLLCRSLAGPLPQHIIGVTGTDGKSSTCDFLYQLLNRCNHPCGLLSTVHMDDGTGLKESPFRQSTPEAPQIYTFLRRCVANGLQTVILEATSHGLSTQEARLIDIPFSGAVYTTISSEHLDFHQSLEAYISSKMALADQLQDDGYLISNATFSQKALLQHHGKGKKLLTFALDQSDKKSTVSATTITSNVDTRVLAIANHRVKLPYGQTCYAENALGALCAAAQVLKQWELPIKALSSLTPIPGRFERIPNALGAHIIIDFAHTPDAFERLFAHIREHFSTHKVIALFGSAGRRDPSKRFYLGKAAATQCNTIYLCNEDPRDEEPQAILTELKRGILAAQSSPTVITIADRKAAINEAIRNLKANDVLLLLGKGHEKSIEMAHHSIPWSEKEIVLGALEACR
ncbi:MAG: Mur ligase family protein [Sphaerochaetaceae bacterium]